MCHDVCNSGRAPHVTWVEEEEKIGKRALTLPKLGSHGFRARNVSAKRFIRLGKRALTNDPLSSYWRHISHSIIGYEILRIVNSAEGKI
jgi:hypothetical protein